MNKQEVDETTPEVNVENVAPEVEEVVAEVETTAEVTPSKEALASEKGWKPLDQFEGDPDTWVDAKEFLAREPLFKALHKTNRELKRLQEINQEMRSMYDNVAKVTREKTISELKVKYEAAAEERDVKTAVETHTKIKELEQQEKEVPRNEEFLAWVEDNEWYQTDKELHKVADRIGLALKGVDPDRPNAEIYEEVTEAIKARYPDKFMNKNKAKAAAVDTGAKRTSTGTVTQKKVPRFEDLPDPAQEVYRKMVKSQRNPNGLFTHQEYMESYLSNGGELKQPRGT